MSGDYPPFSVSEEKGEPHGFDVNVARAYAVDRGLRLEVVPFRWPELEERLLDEDFDVAMSGVTVRGDRLAVAPMTSAVARAEAIVIVPADQTVEQLDQVGTVVAVNRGGHLEKLARARFEHATLRTVDDNRSLPDLLGGGHVHAVVTDTVEMRSFFGVDATIYEVLARDRKAYWVSPDRFDLALDLNQWIGARSLDGWLENERRVWMDDPQPPALPADEATLIDHIAQRLMIMPLIAEVKREKDLPVEAPGREKTLEQSARRAASRAGIDPGRYLALLRVEIEAAKRIQEAVLAGPATVDSEELPDLDDDLRPAIDRIDTSIRTSLVWAAPVQSSVEVLAEALRVDAPLPGLDEASRRAIARAIRAIPAAKRPTSSG